MKKQNLLVLGIAAALVVVVVLIAFFVPQSRSIPEGAPAVEMDQSGARPAATETPAAKTAPAATETPAVEAYLVISVQGTLYEPLPLGGEGVFTIDQDENTTNTVHVTPTSVWMEHSSCDNQDCVDQGTVSLDNMDSRVLYNMIICLPNQVLLELHTAETLAAAFGLPE